MKITTSFLVAIVGLSLSAFAQVTSAQTTGGVVACSIEAKQLASGQVELAWGSANAMFAAIDNGIGSVAADGTRTVTATGNTTYNLHVWNAQGVNGYCSTTTKVGTVLGATTTTGLPVVTVVTNSISNNPQVITLGSVPYTGAEDYIFSVFAIAILFSAVYGTRVFARI